MFEYLMALGRCNWLNQLQGEIQNISQKDPNMAKQLTEMFNASAYETKDELTRQVAQMLLGSIDDLKELFDSHAINILLCTFIIFVLIFLTTFAIFLMYFEKFGADSMKRSLLNQLYAQTGYCYILNNMTLPMWMFRILVGGINEKVAIACWSFALMTGVW